MAKKRHTRRRRRDDDEDLLVRTWATTHSVASTISTHAKPWHQLAYASSGVLSVHTSQGAWVVPPQRAVWIPAGILHRVEVSARASVRTLFFAPRIARGMPSSCQAVQVSPLLRELILRAVALGLLREGVPAQARLARVILDQFEALPVAALQLPMPHDPRARRAAERLIREPMELESLEGAARAAGASKRTLERLFLRETQMTLGRWRQRSRLIEALRLLAAAQPVTRVALDVGYQSPSAFVSAFRRQMGTTPGRYFRGSGTAGRAS